MNYDTKTAKVFNYNTHNVNKEVKAVIINFGDERGDIIVENKNFGKRRKYPDWDREKAGLHPLQLVFTGWEDEHFTNQICERKTRYIGKDDQIHTF